MPDSITCPTCGNTSHNPHDVEQRYCVACHAFHQEMNPEIGRELKISELKAGTVVVLTKEGRPRNAITAWVKDIGEIGVWFYAGELHLNAIFYRHGEELHDDEARLHIFEYLGGEVPTSTKEPNDG